MMKLPIMAKGVGLAAVFGAAVSASAQLVLAPYSFGALPATASAVPGGNLVDSLAASVQDDHRRFTANLESEVYESDGDNPLGGLTFRYRLSNVVDATTQGYDLTGMYVPLDVEAAGLEVAAVPDANRADIAGLGGSIAFLWVGLNTIEVGSSSSWIVMYTPYGAWKSSTVGVSDGTMQDVAALVPVPEPTTYAGLFALGLAGFAAYRRFRA